MKRSIRILFAVLLYLSALSLPVYSATEIPADHPYIQYYGRWNFADPLSPYNSWPGVYITAKFEGTSIGVRLKDNVCYYNVYIDGRLVNILHPASSSIASYTAASGLKDTVHTLMFIKRNETADYEYSFNGLILEDGKKLLPPDPKPQRKIEFIGDSFTSASGNEYTEAGTPPGPEYTNPYTNITEGFGAITARYFNSQYHLSSRSGYGLVLDYLGNYSGNVPSCFDRTYPSKDQPKWDFEQWIPNLVVICLGLNDYSGFGGYTNGTVSQDKADLFKIRYHEFIARIRDLYPGVKILAVAAHVDWIQQTVSKVVQEEKTAGFNDVFYTYFPYYSGGYVNGGHPNVATHYKIADRLIAAIDTINAWEPYKDNMPPKFVKLPASPLTVYDTTYVLNVQTDTYAAVRYSTLDKTYDKMEYEFTVTGKRDHSVKISCRHNQNITYYIRAIDAYGNMSESSAVLRLNVDTTKVILNWKALAYDESLWKKGAAPLRNINPGTAYTPISPVVTAYFRKKFNINDPGKVTGLGLLVKGSDGAVIYLNGQEVSRINMPDGEITYSSLALTQQTMNKMVVINSSGGLTALKLGENILGVEIHSADSKNINISFDSQLIDNTNTQIFRLGSEWYCSDTGITPSDQIKSKTTDVVSGNKILPERTMLMPNYPNPFNPQTAITFMLKNSEHVKLEVFDVLGKTVEVIVNENMNPGEYRFLFNAKNLPSGIYMYRLTAGKFMQTKKMLLIR